MLNLNKFTIPKGIIAKIALLVVLLALTKIFYIIIFRGLWRIIYALVIIEGAVPRYKILVLGVANELSFSMFIPFSLTLLLTSLPELKSYADTLKLRYIGFIVAIFIVIGSSFGLLHGKEVALLFTLIFWSVSAILVVPLLTKKWHANTLLLLGSLFILFSILNMIGVGIFVLSPRISLTYSLLLVYGLINITTGYINLRGISTQLEKILKAEILLLVLLGLYRLYITGGKLL